MHGLCSSMCTFCRGERTVLGMGIAGHVLAETLVLSCHRNREHWCTAEAWHEGRSYGTYTGPKNCR